MDKWYTCCPVIKYWDEHEVLQKTHDFVDGVQLKPIPQWITESPNYSGVRQEDKDDLFDSEAVVGIEYQATALGDPLPSWTGPGVKSIQDWASALVQHVGVAFWLSHPLALRLGSVFTFQNHGGDWGLRQCLGTRSFVQRLHYDKYTIQEKDIKLAAQLFEGINACEPEGALPLALNMLRLALIQRYFPVAFLLRWVCLEALFGPKDSQGVTERMAQRMAAFLSDSEQDIEALKRKVKESYRWRSKIIHGRRQKAIPEDTWQALDEEADDFILWSLRKILLDNNLISTFTGEDDRESFLLSITPEEPVQSVFRYLVEKIVKIWTSGIS